MAVTKDKGFNPMTDRYDFDFRQCRPSAGWAQLDTKQDASYHGIWVNPLTRQMVSYVEGDIYRVTCDTDDEFVAEVREACEWQKKAGYFIGIDGMCQEPIIEAFNRLGLAEFMH